jgi:hypothetical protein
LSPPPTLLGGNLTEFFRRFKELPVRNGDELERLVERAKQAVEGTYSNAVSPGR